MANTVTEKIKVTELTKFGFKANGMQLGYSKYLPEADKTKVVPGAEFYAEIFYGDPTEKAPAGNKFLNKILASIPTAIAPVPPLTVTPVVDTTRAKHFTPKFAKKEEVSSGLSKDEWAAKDVRISRQGCIQAAVHALGPVLGADTLFVEASKLADQMLAYVNKK